MSEISIENVTFSYTEDEVIIDGVNLKIESGDFVCVLGQSGCGKSTLLRLIAGLRKPQKGRILFDGKEREETAPDLGVVFQDYSLFPWFSAGYNIVLAMKQKYPEKSKKELKSIVLDYFEEVGLDKQVYNKYPFELSGGMRQRCAICRSLALNNSVLLMDEPFGALDAVTRARLQDITMDLWKKEKDKTVVFITHDVDEAILLANKIVVLGLKPSRVIYQYEFCDKKALSRSEIVTDQETMKIRSNLLSVLNMDIEQRITQGDFKESSLLSNNQL
ncbi:MAG: ABC transporter ATP-binding protein [Lachnospiraceae bacterium]|nr:ABC transporter ATP-binding protein [Lachnospiraceae bacterium]